MAYQFPILYKVNRVLILLALCFLFLILRVWYLSVVCREDFKKIAQRPGTRTIIDYAERAAIVDRFGVPLATNAPSYSAAIYYGDIRQIPRVRWDIGENGEKIKVLPRLAYIEKLSQFLASELKLEAGEIEDLIHGKAALFPSTPFVIKGELDEKSYFKLRFKEKDWPGLHMVCDSRRVYPQGKVAGDVIGYMGAISGREFEKIVEEKQVLQNYLNRREMGEMPFLPQGFTSPLQVKRRLEELSERAYSFNSTVGKAGLESLFDEELRGFYGKRAVLVDAKGNVKGSLPGGQAKIPGTRLKLSISVELQRRAEELLIENEKYRTWKKDDGMREPWIRGGAVVVMDPKSGEVLALASHPRIDPSDFIPKASVEAEAMRRKKVDQALESTHHIGDVWDGKVLFEREVFSKQGVGIESVRLTWDRYLEMVLGEGCGAERAMASLTTMGMVVELLGAAQTALEVSGQESMPLVIEALFPVESERAGVAEIRKKLASLDGKVVEVLQQRLGFCGANSDKVLVLDLCRLLTIQREKGLIDAFSPAEWMELQQAYAILRDELKRDLKVAFKRGEFEQWRALHFADYLKEKRALERANKQYERPYVDYLSAVFREKFDLFWEEKKERAALDFLLGKEMDGRFARLAEEIAKREEGERVRLLQSMRSFDDLTAPLWGNYSLLRGGWMGQRECGLAGAFYPVNGFGYGRSSAYRQSAPSGSVFKIVTSYAALKQRYDALCLEGRSLHDLSPLTLIDDIQFGTRSPKYGILLGKRPSGEKIYQMYGGGRLPKVHPGIGQIDIERAIETSSNMYFSLLAAEHLAKPTDLVDAARLFGFGSKAGIDLPGEYGGNLPGDVATNKTGLYSFAIGHHTLVVTPLQMAVMVSAVANGGEVLRPKIAIEKKRLRPDRDIDTVLSMPTYPFKEALELVGLRFPLFVESVKRCGRRADDQIGEKEVVRQIDLPKEVQRTILRGMYRTINGESGSARPEVIRRVFEDPQVVKNYTNLKGQLIGKTGTAEFLDKRTLDVESAPIMRNHVWFACVSYDHELRSDMDSPGDPELVVITYLRYGRAGKEGAPICAELVKKWREIQERERIRTRIESQN